MSIETLTEAEREWLFGYAPYALAEKALRIIDAHAAERAALVKRAELAEALLARTQDASPKRPHEACSHSVQLDYDIGQHLQRNGWAWDAVNRVWRLL